MTIAGHGTLLCWLPCSSRSGHKLDAGRALWPTSEDHKHLSPGPSCHSSICISLCAHVSKCLDLLYDSNLPFLRPQLSHCFSLGGVMNPSAQRSLQAAPSHRAHLFWQICSNTDLSEIANTERHLYFFFLTSAHIYPILPLCRLTGRCNIPEHLGAVLKGSPIDRASWRA